MVAIVATAATTAMVATGTHPRVVPQVSAPQTPCSTGCCAGTHPRPAAALAGHPRDHPTSPGTHIRPTTHQQYSETAHRPTIHTTTTHINTNDDMGPEATQPWHRQRQRTTGEAMASPKTSQRFLPSGEEKHSTHTRPSPEPYTLTYTRTHTRTRTHTGA